MSQSILRWLENPRDDRGLRFAADPVGWEFVSYDELSQRAHRFAAHLIEQGLRPDGVVCIILPTKPSFVAAIFGTWLAGGTVCPLVPPMMFQDLNDYAMHAATILQAAKPQLVITEDLLENVVRTACAGAEGVPPPLVLNELVRSYSTRTPPEIGLLQFTSGSTGIPRGVRVSMENLASNTEVLRRWAGMDADDVLATWLPMYHDMGLIGALLMPVATQSTVAIMRPDQFVRAPLRWLDCFGRGDAVVNGAPNFGYAYVASRVTPEDLQGSDFSRWRVAVAGAEAIDPCVLESFANLLEPFGFQRSTFMPSYGLAEATLSIAGVARGDVPRVVKINWDRLEFGNPVEIEASSVLGEFRVTKGEGWLTSSGIVHEGHFIDIVDDGGADLPTGCLGEIVVRGPSVAVGYTPGATTGGTRFEGDRLFTGDAGFFFGGELFVIGRVADSVKVRGRNVYVEDLETRLVNETSLKRGRCAVVAFHEKGVPAIAILVEAPPGQWVAEVESLLLAELGSEAHVKIFHGERGLIRRTSSGKPRRRAMWEALVRGELPAIEISDAR